MKRFFALLFFCLALTGCATPGQINDQMKSWEGADKNDLIAKWGPPSQTMSDGAGGEIFIYSVDRNYVVPGQAVTNVNSNAYAFGNAAYGNAQGTTTYTPPRQYGYSAQRMFWINSDGKIYRWSWKGM